MASWLSRSGRQLVRLSSSSSRAPTKKIQPLRVLTSFNNNICRFSTDSSSSSSGMIQESNPKDVPALKSGKRRPSPAEYFGMKVLNDIVNDKPVPPLDDPHFDNFVDDLIKKLPDLNPDMKAITSATGLPDDLFATGPLDCTLPTQLKGDNFYYTLDTNGLYLTVNVSGFPKEDLVVWVDKQFVLVTSTDEKVREAIVLPGDHYFDPVKVTGSIMEDGQLKISFPTSKEGGVDPKEHCFQVNLV